MAVLQEPENVLPRLGSFPRSHLKEKVWETENENNPPIKKNHNVKSETSCETKEDSLEDSGKGKKSISSQLILTLWVWQIFFF